MRVVSQTIESSSLLPGMLQGYRFKRSIDPLLYPFIAMSISCVMCVIAAAMPAHSKALSSAKVSLRLGIALSVIADWPTVRLYRSRIIHVAIPIRETPTWVCLDRGPGGEIWGIQSDHPVSHHGSAQTLTFPVARALSRSFGL